MNKSSKPIIMASKKVKRMEKQKILVLGNKESVYYALDQDMFDYEIVNKVKQQGTLIWYGLDGTKIEEFDEKIKQLSKKVKSSYLPVMIVIGSIKEEKVMNTQKHYVQMLVHHYHLNQVKAIVGVPIQEKEQILTLTKTLIEKSKDEQGKQGLLKKKRIQSQTVVTSSVSLGLVVASLNPTTLPDATFLAPIEAIMIRSIAKIYEMETKSEAKEFIDTLLQMGTVGLVAKKSIEMIKAIPGIHVGAQVLNGLVAGTIIMLLGEGSTSIFEQIYLGNKTLKDIKWAQDYLQSQLTQTILDQVLGKVSKQIDNKKNRQNLK